MYTDNKISHKKIYIVAIISTLLFICVTILIQSFASISRDPAYYINNFSNFIFASGSTESIVDQILNPFVLSNYFLYYPVLVIAKTGFGIVTSHKIFCFLVFFWASLHLFSFVSFNKNRPLSWLMIPAFAFVGLLFPVDGFGQKEYLFFLLVTPYIFHVLDECEAGGWRERAPADVVIATCIGLVIKPYFIGIWVLLEAYRFWKFRDWRCLLNRLNICVSLIHIVYYSTVLVLLFRLPYSSQDIAWVFAMKRGYWQKSIVEIVVRRYSLLWLIASLALCVSLFSSKLRSGAIVWALAITGALFSVLIQSLGVDYHWHLVTGVAGMAMFWSISVLERGKPLFVAMLLAGFFLILATLRLVPFAAREMNAGALVRQISVAVNSHSSVGKLTLFSTDYFPLHPVLAQTGLPNGSRFQSFWFLDGLAQDFASQTNKTMLARISSEVAVDLSRNDSIVMVPTAPSPGLALLFSQEVVANRLSLYREVGESNGHKILVP